MSQVLCEQIAASALRDYLLASLPAKVAAVNLTRAAVLKASVAGPYVFSAGGTLGLSVTPNVLDTFTQTTFSTGSQTATQVAAAINTAMGATVATVDFADRLVLTSPTPPLAPNASVLEVRGGVNGTDANTVFGWDGGGEKVTTTALVAPGSRGICDGLPLQPDFGPSGENGGSPIVVVIGDRGSKPVKPDVRRDQYIVTLDVSILRTEPQQQNHRTREHIHAAVRCVRETLLTDAGRQLGRAGQGDIGLVTETQCRVAALPFRFTNPQNNNVISPLFDGASMALEIRVFERPAAS